MANSFRKDTANFAATDIHLPSSVVRIQSHKPLLSTQEESAGSKENSKNDTTLTESSSNDIASSAFIPVCYEAIPSSDLPIARDDDDLRTSAQNRHILWLLFWFSVACFGAGAVWLIYGREVAAEFIAAYILEYMLSIDNIFVFMLAFKYFDVVETAQEFALKWGILGAVVLRGLMISLGSELVGSFHFLFVPLAVILLISVAKQLLASGDDDDDDNSLEDNRIVQWAKCVFCQTVEYHGNRLFIVSNDGCCLATPLLLVIVVVELLDVVFALDSVPAVLGLSKRTLVIYSSSILAVMGLRSLFFVVRQSMKGIRFLNQTMGFELAFVGIKMLADLLHIEVPVFLSLGMVAGIALAGIMLSVLFPIPERIPAMHMQGQIQTEETSRFDRMVRTTSTKDT